MSQASAQDNVLPDRRKFLGVLGVSSALATVTTRATAEDHSERSPQPTNFTEQQKENCLKVALLQMAPDNAGLNGQRDKADVYCRQAALSGADIALMPEMWSIGYQGFVNRSRAATLAWQDRAVPRDGPWVTHFCRLAKELGMAIAVTYLEEWETAPRNTVSVIDRLGNMVLTYAKVHTCDFAFEAAVTPGDDWPTVALDTKKGAVSVGAMICFDREFPESARCLMLAGAELLLIPNACLLDSLRVAQLQVRAFENSMAMTMANYPKPVCNGNSVAFDASGYCLVVGGEQESIEYAHIDVLALQQYRRSTIWGGAWRRPQRYKALTATSPLPIFRRKNAYGKDFIADER